MQLKFVSVLAAALVMVIPLGIQVAQAQPTPTGEAVSLITDLKLTPEQQTRLEQIRSQTRTQVLNLLTPDQQAQFKAGLGQGKGLPEAIVAMNLSDAQKGQLRTILQTARSQVSDTLTTAQKRQLFQKLRSLR